MSAAELRKAAETLRERADQAGDPPWTAQVHDDGRAWINAPDEPHAIGMHGWPAAARYIATMHPGVGLALADWLEEHADDHTESRHQCRWVTCSGETLARLINGGAA